VLARRSQYGIPRLDRRRHQEENRVGGESGEGGDARRDRPRRRGAVPLPYRTGDRPWVYDILEAQVRAYRPDVLYCMAMETVGTEFLRRVKGHYSFAVGQSAAPIPSIDIGGYDLILSSLPNQVEHFRRQGMKSEYLRLAFEPRVLDWLTRGTKSCDIAFAGNLGGHHKAAVLTLEELCQRFDVKVWGYGAENLPPGSAIRKSLRGPIWGIEMFQAMRDARLVFNRHIDISEQYANNMRLFEATGVGSCLLTDVKKNLGELFVPGSEVLAYRSGDECLELAEYYLRHDSEREAIAGAGQRRTLSEHTYYHRMADMAEIVRRHLG
jgi:hypothetical protein